MPVPKAPPVELNEVEKRLLESIAETEEEYISKRALIILEAAKGESNTNICKKTATSFHHVSTWRKKWLNATFTAQTEEELRESIRQFLESKDGRPRKCKSAEVDKIIEISHWVDRSHRSKNAKNELIASEVVRRKIVSDISPRSIGRLLEQYERETAASS
ncbi:MAG: helix-turn-helix domain-containing protein [Scytonema sp. PMC 1069.18]|nr:helix-turn-helix domain-containing protein [Scytonema sp. PMC 1069.18]MEC4888236.1 helix-turn-helix domain-containing protein [Scytonema sp. PMC 1070.18]